MRYKAWGEERPACGSPPCGTTPTTYRYTGQRWEAGLGLYFYNARWYDPALGRFVQADTIIPAVGNPQRLNRFSYVANGPLRFTDPTGHKECEGACQGETYYPPSLDHDRPPMDERYLGSLPAGSSGSRNGATIEGIVMHMTEGATAQSALDTLTERELGANYLVDRDGTIYPLVSDNRATWHAGGVIGKEGVFTSSWGNTWTGRAVNEHTIGIEVVGFTEDGYSLAQQMSTEKLVAYLAYKYHISPEDIVSHKGVGKAEGKPDGGEYLAQLRRYVYEHSLWLDEPLHGNPGYTGY